MDLKIVLCKSTLLGPVSGADEIMLNYAEHLHKAGYDVRVVLLYAPNDDDQYNVRLREQAAWILFVIIPTYNPKHLRKLPYDFCLAGLIFSLPLITIGAANAFGWLLAYLRGAIVIADWITGIAGHDPHMIMLLMVLLFTIVGDFIEPVPTIIIFMPLVNALAQAGNINPVHMGVVLIATLAFGLITPPYGLVLLMASKFVGVRFSQ